MTKSLHQLEIDVFKVAFRPCRRFQEKIYDYYLSGKPRFVWETMRQSSLLGRSNRYAEICLSCPFCITRVPEGCMIKLEGLTTFLRIVDAIKPDSLFLKYRYDSVVFDYETTRDLWDSLMELREVCEATTWPIAHGFSGGEPSYVTRPDGRISYLCFEWEGMEEDTYIYSNDGYILFLSRSGILVRENFGDAPPELFTRIFREGYAVYGERADGKLSSFPPVKGKYPDWDDSLAGRSGELVFLEPLLSSVYGDLLGMLTDYFKTAIAAETGLYFRVL